MHTKGVRVAAAIDIRPDAPRNPDFEVLAGAQVRNTWGRLGLTFIEVGLLGGDTRVIECGALAVSGGWYPNAHLSCHHGRTRGKAILDGRHHDPSPANTPTAIDALPGRSAGVDFKPLRHALNHS